MDFHIVSRLMILHAQPQLLFRCLIMSLKVGSKSTIILYRIFRSMALTLIGILDLSFGDSCCSNVWKNQRSSLTQHSRQQRCKQDLKLLHTHILLLVSVVSDDKLVTILFVIFFCANEILIFFIAMTSYIFFFNFQKKNSIIFSCNSRCNFQQRYFLACFFAQCIVYVIMVKAYDAPLLKVKYVSYLWLGWVFSFC